MEEFIKWLEMKIAEDEKLIASGQTSMNEEMFLTMNLYDRKQILAKAKEIFHAQTI